MLRILFLTSGEHVLNTLGSTVERMSSTEYLGVLILEDFSWTKNTASLVKKAQQHLYYLCNLKRANAPVPILVCFYRGTIESILINCVTVWLGNCSIKNHQVPAAHNEHSRKDHWYLSSLHTGHLQHSACPQSKQHCEKCHPPLTHASSVSCCLGEGIGAFVPTPPD